MEPQALQSFYADIRAARIAKIPVELTSRSLLQSGATPSESKLRSLAKADKENPASIDARHQAAIDIYAQLGSMAPVLDGLSVRAIASRRFSQMLRRVLWYLALVLLVALLGLLYFKFYIVPEYDLVRQDMRLHYGLTDFNGDMFPYIVPMIVVVAVLLLTNVSLLLSSNTGFLLKLFGGQKVCSPKSFIVRRSNRSIVSFAISASASSNANHRHAVCLGRDRSPTTLQFHWRFVERQHLAKSKSILVYQVRQGARTSSHPRTSVLAVDRWGRGRSRLRNTCVRPTGWIDP